MSFSEICNQLFECLLSVDWIDRNTTIKNGRRKECRLSLTVCVVRVAFMDGIQFQKINNLGEAFHPNPLFHDCRETNVFMSRMLWREEMKADNGFTSLSFLWFTVFYGRRHTPVADLQS